MILKYELKKIMKNKVFLAASIISLVIIAGIFFIGYYSSQLTFAERTNAEIGYPNLHSEIISNHSGEFTDEKIKDVLSDYMERFQSDVNKQPMDVFSWGIADLFIDKKEDIYLKMGDAMENEGKITIDQIDVATIQERGFASFANPLKLGNYNTWGNLYNVTNQLFILASLLIIFICSSIFSSEASSNINQLLLSTKHGRGKLTIAKIIAATGVSILVFLAIQTISFIFFYFYHGISGWDASIQTNFSVFLYSFPVELNNIQVFFLVIAVQMVGILSIVSVTLFISSITKSPFISLAISLGVFVTPYLLGTIFQSGIIAKLLNLFSIQHYQVEKMLTIMQTNTVYFFDSFSSNVILTICVGLVIKLIADVTVYYRIKFLQLK